MILAPSFGAFYYDDQAAIREGRAHDGFAYAGHPLTPDFEHVRIPATALGIGLILSDGSLAWGDMVSVQYSGAAGRDPLFMQKRIAAFCEEQLKPHLVGRDARDAIANCAFAWNTDEQPPTAVRYGVSQALLTAAAHARRCTMAEVVADAFDLPAPTDPVPMFAQSGDDRRKNVDKMILKQVDILPHGLINSREKFGEYGSTFLDYVRWCAKRIGEIGNNGYRPTLHFDLYGWMGIGIGTDPKDIARFIARTEEAAQGLPLHIESPADYGERAAQVENYAELVRELERIGCDAKLVADEHCNTLSDIREFCDAKAAHIVQIKTPDVGCLFDTARAIAYAKGAGVGAYSGGTSAETDLSARACVHVALAMQASMMLAKPGMGVDEGIAIVGNEQARTLTQIRHFQADRVSA